jgi:hypothetical protein
METDEAGIGPLRPLTATQQFTVTATLASAVLAMAARDPVAASAFRWTAACRAAWVMNIAFSMSLCTFT